MSWIERRQAIIKKIKSTFYKTYELKVGVNKEMLLFSICSVNGASKRSAKEYVEELLSIGFIEEINGELWLSKREIDKLKQEEKSLSSEEQDILRKD
jgi:hypothetical protein